jgi:drug/metabolite transporter (DMT)-like permease
MSPDDQSDRGDSSLGVVLVAGSAVAYSTAGLFTRLIHVDLWTLIFWRGLFSSAFLLSVDLAQRGRQWRHTTVADVAIIYGTAPFVTAGIALVVLRERTGTMTLLCSVLALVGVAVMFGGSHVSRHLTGDLLAVGMTVLMSVMIIATRRSSSAPLAIAALSSLASSLVAAPLAHAAVPHLPQYGELALFGVTQLGLGLLLLTAGSRHLSASRVALVGGLDVPLAPIWVWIAFAETPSLATIVGGVTVMAAVLLNTLATNSPRPPVAPDPSKRRHTPRSQTT